MKHLLIASLATIALISCQSANSENEIPQEEAQAYMNFGDSTFTVEDAFSAKELMANFSSAGAKRG